MKLAELVDIIISEGRYDNLVTFFSREIVEQIKKRRKFYSKDGILVSRTNKKPKKFGDLNDPDVEFRLKVKIIYDKSIKVPFDITGITVEDKVQLIIVLNPELLPGIYNDLIADIKGTLRHEIEHVAQMNFFSKDTPTGDGNLEGLEYFMAPNEIPAFVHGFHKQAKVSNKTWTAVAEKYLKTQDDEKLTNKDIKKILNVWMAYAKKHLPNAKF